MTDLLLEIGCENLPPHGIGAAFESLRDRARKALDEQRLAYDEIYATGAPRRLVLIVRGLADRQTAHSETVTGPPVDRAFDANGEPTKAAIGFARARGVDVKSLKTVTTAKGDFIGLTQRLPVRSAGRILREEIPVWIGELKFPKLMRWEKEGVLFARPIRWIVCLLGSSPVRVTVAGVRSGNTTYTVPWIHPRGLRVRSAAHYLDVMKKSGVIVDHTRRREAIEAHAHRVAAKAGLKLIEDSGLFNELTYMLEEPRPLTGDFDSKYLSLPAEVVTTAMKAHQRYLAFRKRGKLVPKFMTFTEGKVGSPATVRRGNEKVLRARLEDALFYWNEDLATGMDGLARKLDAIVFIEGLGSLGDKSRRIARIAPLVARALRGSGGSGPDAHALERAAHVAKADLASEMIKDGKEFTLLQGLIGSRYAAACGEHPDVVAALSEQYLPRSPGDALPKSGAGKCLSVADRMDTIAGCFLAGFQPTGSQDPYALRRQANGLIRIVDGLPEFSIAVLIEAAIEGYREAGFDTPVAPDDAIGALTDFFKVRVATYLKEKGAAYDVVDAVASVAWANPSAALSRAMAVQSMRGDDAFELLITGVKRVGNILDPAHKHFGLPWDTLEEAHRRGRLPNGGCFDTARFEDPAESALHRAVAGALPRVREADDRADVEAVLGHLSGLGPAIDTYFDKVLVNCDDSALRANRHGYLAAVFALFSKYADFSHIVEGGRIGAG